MIEEQATLMPVSRVHGDLKGLTIHKLSRILEGRVDFPLPLCWDAEQIACNGKDYDTENWFLAWDLGAIDPMGLSFAYSADGVHHPHLVNCQACLEWMHS